MLTKKALPRALAVVIALFLMLFPLLPAVQAAPTQAQSPTVQQQIDQITQAVEQLRGLTAKTPISFEFLTRDQLRDKLITDFDRDWPVEERVRTQDLMVMLGWLEPGQDLYQIELNVMTEQIAGFYDPTDKKLYLITDQQELGPMDEVAMAHEICHALQDQYFNLDQPPFDVEDGHQDDAESAATALVEGDASRISDEYQAEYISLSDLLGQDLSQYSTKQFDKAPTYIQDSLLFPYTEGLSFVESKVGTSNTKANALFADVPDSTEQIMHPSSYPGQQPETVTLPDLSEALGSDWAKDEYNVLGEFDVEELFKPYLSNYNARRAAEGWGGNIYEYWKRGEDKLLVQSYTWDTRDDAVEFTDAFETYIPDRFPGAASSQQDGWMRWDAGGYAWALKLSGTRTDVVQSTDATATRDVTDALGPGETIGGAGPDWQTGGEDQTTDQPGTNWLVIGAVIALAVLGTILIGGMLTIKRRNQNLDQ